MERCIWCCLPRTCSWLWCRDRGGGARSGGRAYKGNARSRMAKLGGLRAGRGGGAGWGGGGRGEGGRGEGGGGWGGGWGGGGVSGLRIRSLMQWMRVSTLTGLARKSSPPLFNPPSPASRFETVAVRKMMGVPL